MSIARSSARVLAAAALTLGFATAARADILYSTVNAPPKPEELDHAEILSSIYGGTFMGDGLNYSNGLITAIRVADGGLGGPLDLTCNADQRATDQTWSGGPARLVARAKFASDNSVFGWHDDTEGGAFQALLNTATLDVPVAFAGSANFRWAIDDVSTGRHHTSRDADNFEDPDDVLSATHDQMVTYRIVGLDTTECVWTLFWEDRITPQHWNDYDYNDSVIEIRAVPAPATLALIGGALIVTGRRRRS